MGISTEPFVDRTFILLFIQIVEGNNHQHFVVVVRRRRRLLSSDVRGARGRARRAALYDHLVAGFRREAVTLDEHRCLHDVAARASLRLVGRSDARRRRAGSACGCSGLAGGVLVLVVLVGAGIVAVLAAIDVTVPEALLLVLAPGVLNEPGAVLLALAPEGRGDGLVADLAGPRLHLGELTRLLDRIALSREEVLGECVEDIHAKHKVALTYGNVHRYNLVLVGLVYLQRRLQHVEKVRQLVVADVLSTIGIELLPDLVVHVVIVVGQALLHVFRRLRVVLENDGDVHVDDDQKADDEVGEQKCDAYGGGATVARVADLRVWRVAVLLVYDAIEDAIPAGRR